MVLPTRPKTSLLRRLCSPRNPLVWLFVLFILIWTIINNEDGAVDNSFLLGQRNDMIRSGSSSSSANVKDEGHRVAGLVCDSYGGPLTSAATNEMVYWRDIPQDTSFQSPFRTQATEELFFTFEPDEGGWNNIRMAMETAIAMAVAMGRTLVLPPKMHFYLLWNGANQDQNVFDFADFFHLDSVAAEHGNQALKVITLEEFLRRQAMTGQLLDSKTGLPSFPPGNKTDWRGSVINYQAASSGEGKVLWEWMRSVTTVLPWSYEQCVATFPSRPGKADADGMDAYLAQLKTRDMAIFGGDGGKSWHSLWQQRRNSFNSNPAPVNGSATDRLAELLANRRNLCVYTEELQKAKVVHVLGEQRTGYRLLIHFYAYLFFEDWKQDLWIKRFIRDHFRYVDEIQCAAARVIEQIRIRSRAKSGESKENSGSYDSFHIRRGDFQYQDVWLPAEAIYEENTKLFVPDGRTVYIATDEKNKTFFEPFREHYNVLFLDDFAAQLVGISPNYYGMLDQLIASRGDVFVGAYYSTFTGYINRMRGYHAQKDPTLEGYDQGVMKSYYYVPAHMANLRTILQQYGAVQPAFWAQEFPVAWRDLDHNV